MTLTKFDRENIGKILTDPRKDWFTAQLMRLVAKADSHHRVLLAKGFPEEVALVEQYLGLGLTSVAENEPKCGDACGTDCPCYRAGTEAQREPAGGRTA